MLPRDLQHFSSVFLERTAIYFFWIEFLIHTYDHKDQRLEHMEGWHPFLDIPVQVYTWNKTVKWCTQVVFQGKVEMGKQWISNQFPVESISGRSHIAFFTNLRTDLNDHGWWTGMTWSLPSERCQAGWSVTHFKASWHQGVMMIRSSWNKLRQINNKLISIHRDKHFK